MGAQCLERLTKREAFNTQEVDGISTELGLLKIGCSVAK